MENDEKCLSLNAGGSRTLLSLSPPPAPLRAEPLAGSLLLAGSYSVPPRDYLAIASREPIPPARRVRARCPRRCVEIWLEPTRADEAGEIRGNERVRRERDGIGRIGSVSIQQTETRGWRRE